MPNTERINKDVVELKGRLLQLAHLRSADAVLSWDQQVNMPSKAATSRAKTLAELSGIVHEKFLTLDRDNLLTGLKKQLDKNLLNDADAVVVADAWRTFSRVQKLPEAFVREYLGGDFRGSNGMGTSPSRF